MKPHEAVFICVDLALFFVALALILLFSRPSPEVQRVVPRPCDRGARVPAVRQCFDLASCEWAFMGRELSVYRASDGSVNGVEGFTTFGYNDELLVFLFEEDERVRIRVDDRLGERHSTLTDFPLSGQERVAVCGDTLFLAQIGRVLAFRIGPGGVKHLNTLDPHYRRVFHLACQENGLLVLWCGDERPETLLTYHFDHGFLKRSEAPHVGDSKSRLVAGADWYALDTVRGLHTTHPDPGEDHPPRGVLVGHGDNLWYDREDTPFYDRAGEECELVSLGQLIVVRKDGQLVTCA